MGMPPFWWNEYSGLWVNCQAAVGCQHSVFSKTELDLFEEKNYLTSALKCDTIYKMFLRF